MKRSEIVIKNMQVKSLEKAYKLAEAIEIIEGECGIHEVRITFENIFVCPDIDLTDMGIHSNGTYKTVGGLLKKLQ